MSGNPNWPQLPGTTAQRPSDSALSLARTSQLWAGGVRWGRGRAAGPQLLLQLPPAHLQNGNNSPLSLVPAPKPAEFHRRDSHAAAKHRSPLEWSKSAQIHVQHGEQGRLHTQLTLTPPNAPRSRGKKVLDSSKTC